MSDTNSILVLVFGTLIFTLFAIFIILYASLQKRKQYQYELEKKDMELQFNEELMKSRMEVQEETLKQLSEELHDNIAQVLGLAKMNMHIVAEQATPDTKELAVASTEIIGDAIKDVRAMSHTLNGSLVLRQGLKESIEKEVKHISDAKNINCNFNYSGEPLHLDEDKELMIFRIIQESIANAVKHGKPGKIDIQVSNLPNDLTVLVTDDGVGFDTNTSGADHGLGLSNIRERARLLKGTLKISSAINKGTTVQLKIPVTDA